MKSIYKKLISSVIFISITLGISTANAMDDNSYGQQKVVYHINYDTPKKQASTLKNIQNHINAVGAKNIDIKVVLHGNGLSLLLNPTSLPKLAKFKNANATENMIIKIDNLKAQGVNFNVCANTVKGRKVNVENDLYNVDTKDIVKSGVAELAHLQKKGYMYLRP